VSHLPVEQAYKAVSLIPELFSVFSIMKVPYFAKQLKRKYTINKGLVYFISFLSTTVVLTLASNIP